MKKILYILLLFIPFVIYTQDIGGDYYVATDGDDEAAGTYEAPWRTLIHAAATIDAGDTCYIMGGTYYPETSIVLANSGTKESPICFWGYPGDTIIIDGSDRKSHMTPNASHHVYNYGIYMLQKQHIHFKNLIVRNMKQEVWNADTMYLAGLGAIHGYLTANLTFEDITIHDCGVKGYYVTSGAYSYTEGSGSQGIFWNDYDTTRWINCDVYNIYDSLSRSLVDDSPQDGNAGDAWKTQNFLRGVFYYDSCRAWNYTDDAFDPDGNGYHKWKDCWVMSGNRYQSATMFEANGWKMTAPNANELKNDSLPNPNDTIFRSLERCVVTFCLGTAGYYNNLYIYPYSASGRSNNAVFYNCIAYNNYYNYFNYSGANDPTIIFRNCITYGANRGSPCSDKDYEEIEINGQYRESHNNWDYINHSCGDWEFTDTVTVTSDDFVNALDSATIVSQLTAPRQLDGTLPAIHPFALNPLSDLINAGTQIPASDGSGITLTYFGSAPDIGAYEYTTQSAKNITSFTATNARSTAVIDTTAKTVSLIVGGTKTSITPTIIHTGASIAPSGAQDFTNPVTYTVTADDESTQEWTVSVTTRNTPHGNGKGSRVGGKRIMIEH